MPTHATPAFTTAELDHGRPLTTADEVSALPDESVILLLSNLGRIDGDVYERFGSRWVYFDPDGWADGNAELPSDGVVIRAGIQRRQIIHLHSPGAGMGAVVTTDTDIASCPDGSVVLVVVPRPDGTTHRHTIFTRHPNGWVMRAPEQNNPVTDSERLWAFIHATRATARIVWTPPSTNKQKSGTVTDSTNLAPTPEHPAGSIVALVPTLGPGAEVYLAVDAQSYECVNFTRPKVHHLPIAAHRLSEYAAEQGRPLAHLFSPGANHGKPAEDVEALRSAPVGTVAVYLLEFEGKFAGAQTTPSVYIKDESGWANYEQHPDQPSASDEKLFQMTTAIEGAVGSIRLLWVPAG